jgi:hypothetical protein
MAPKKAGSHGKTTGAQRSGNATAVYPSRTEVLEHFADVRRQPNATVVAQPAKEIEALLQKARVELAYASAEDVFRQLRVQLEEAHMGRYVAIDIENGNYVVADSRLRAQALHRKTYGDDRRSCTFHIGTSR